MTKKTFFVKSLATGMFAMTLMGAYLSVNQVIAEDTVSAPSIGDVTSASGPVNQTFYCYSVKTGNPSTNKVDGTWIVCDTSSEACENKRTLQDTNYGPNSTAHNYLTSTCAAQQNNNAGYYPAGTPVAPGSNTTYAFLAPLPDNNGHPIVFTNLPNYIKSMYSLFIALSAVIAVIMIVYGGILYMSTDAISGKREGKDIIVRTLWGLLLIIGSFVILVSINPTLVTITPQKLDPSSNPYNKFTDSAAQGIASGPNGGGAPQSGPQGPIGSAAPNQSLKAAWVSNIQVQANGATSFLERYPAAGDLTAQKCADDLNTLLSDINTHNDYIAGNCTLQLDKNRTDDHPPKDYYCTQISANVNGVSSIITTDCSGNGQAFNYKWMVDSTHLDLCNTMLACYVKGNHYDPASAKCVTDASDPVAPAAPFNPINNKPTCFVNNNQNWTINVFHKNTPKSTSANKGNITPDETAGAAYIEDPGALPYCQNRQAYWQGQKLQTVTSQCYDANSN